jgi:uncharacterized protein (TIGR03435 family)
MRPLGTPVLRAVWLSHCARSSGNRTVIVLLILLECNTPKATPQSLLPLPVFCHAADRQSLDRPAGRIEAAKRLGRSKAKQPGVTTGATMTRESGKWNEPVFDPSKITPLYGGIMSQGLKLAFSALIIVAGGMFAQSPAARPAFDAFEVATIKPTPPDYQGGRFIAMQSAHLFGAKNYTLKALVGAAYNLTPRAVSGGPSSIDSDRYDIVAKTPNEIRPDLDEQMSMLRKLLADRFKLTFHRERKELSVYALAVARKGPKLKQSTEPPDAPPALVNRIFPGRVLLPARNATMAQLASMMQRAVLDRPVLDKTGLSGKYDFDLEWTPGETQFGGQGPPGAPEIPLKPDLFAALQQQLGLRLEAAKGPVEVLVIDRVERPSEN